MESFFLSAVSLLIAGPRATLLCILSTAERVSSQEMLHCFVVFKTYMPDNTNQNDPYNLDKFSSLNINAVVAFKILATSLLNLIDVACSHIFDHICTYIHIDI